MGQSEGPVRVGVVDGYPVSRAGLTAFLEGEPGITMIGEADDVEGALRLAAEERPDLIMLGYDLLRGPDGVQVCRSLKRTRIPPRVLALVGSNFAEARLPFFLAGADSYLHRRSDRTAIVNAVRRTFAGESVWDAPEGTESTSMLHGDPAAARLTSRELEVLTLKVHRHTNPEIARDLNLSLHTVKHHVSSIIRKLGEIPGGLRP
jgi:DNA-binding NarL/FixJ family response regulator